MRNRPLKMGILAAVVVVAGVAVWCYFDREPESRGRPLSYWTDQVLTGEFRDGTRETFDALKALGPHSAPVLVRAMMVTDSPLRGYYSGLRSKLPASVNALFPHQRLKAPDARNNAFSGLCWMGPAAKAQVPELIRLLKHPDSQVRSYAALVLAGIGADAKAAVPFLREASLDSSLSGYATEALRRIEGKISNGEIKTAAVASAPRPSDVTTLLGTWGWNVTSNHLGDPKPDFWWNRVKDKGFLTPTNGAAAALVGGTRFESVDRRFLETAKLNNAAISSDALKPGCVVVFRTADGSLGKLQVIGYKALHDFSFPEASLLEQDWRDFVIKEPNVEQYHLQVRWFLF